MIAIFTGPVESAAGVWAAALRATPTASVRTMTRMRFEGTGNSFGVPCGHSRFRAHPGLCLARNSPSLFQKLRACWGRRPKKVASGDNGRNSLDYRGAEEEGQTGQQRISLCYSPTLASRACFIAEVPPHSERCRTAARVQTLGRQDSGATEPPSMRRKVFGAAAKLWLAISWQACRQEFH